MTHPTMSNVELVQLTQAGDAVTFRVTSCAPMAIGQYPEIEYIGVTAEGTMVAVRVPESSSKRQLERIEHTQQSIVGQTVTIKRDPNAKQPSKPYWGIWLESTPIDRPVPVANAAPGSSNGNGHAPAVVDEKEKASHLYARITDYVIATIVPKYKAAGIPVTHEGTAAIVATIFINHNR